MKKPGLMISRGLIYAFSALSLLPLLFVLTGSLMGRTEFTLSYGATALPFPPFTPRMASLSQYVDLLFNTPGYLFAYWNSLFIGLSICLFQILTAIPCAYGLSKLRFKGRQTLLFLYVVMMMMPFQVTMLPLYQLVQKMGLFDSHWALIVPEIFAPFTVFFMAQSLKLLPDELIEALKLESSSPMILYKHLIIPICKPAIIAGAVLSFVETWNMVEKPLIFIQDIRVYPLSMLLHQAGELASPATLAGCVLYMVPVLLIWMSYKTEICSGISKLEIK